jgi:hypothetical protein
MKAPIRFLRENGQAHSVPPGIPVVRCAISSSSKEINGQTEMNFTELAKEGCWALVDTGADHSVIDAVYAQDLGLTPVGQVSVSGVTAASIHAVYRNAFYLLDADLAVTGEFASAPLRAQGRLFHLILGMTTISKGALVMDFRRGIYEIDFS